ncbi:MAG: hypothetical protein HKO07_07540, partial [Pseudomonadales bacterium]|nr:hypothetical protein [Pseudomonadales bacterium]
MKVLKYLAGLVLLMLIVVSVLCWHYFYAVTPIRPELNGVYSEHDLQSGAHSRHFGVYRPVGQQHTTPVFIVLHGSMGDADSIRKRTAYEFEMLADQHRFLVVYPDGYKHHWNGCRRSADYAANTERIDDVGFMRTLVDWLVAHYSIDPQQVFIGGYSNGGHLSYRIALEAPALVSGIATFNANLPAAANLGCKESAIA